MNNISKSKQGYKKTKWLFGKEIEIPKEWNIKKFRDISKINPEKIDKEYRNQNILYVDIGSIDRFQIVDYDVFVLTDRPSRAQRIIKKNDVIVSTVRPYLKAFSKIKKDKSNMVCSTGFTVIRTKNKDDGELIFQFIQSKLFEIHMVREMEGLAYPAVTSKVVANSLIPYPIDKHEKQKIASILSRVDALIELTQKTVENTERLKRGLMQHLLTRGIGHTTFKKVKWFFGKKIEIPEEWHLQTLDNLNVKSTSGGTPSRKKPKYYNGNIVWIKSGELENNFVNNSEEKITSEALRNSSAKIFPKNTVLVAMYGATIGKTAILVKEGSTNQAICAILPNNIFHEYFLQQFLVKNRNILVTFGMGAGQPNINQEIIRNFKYLVPLLSEQTKIASILSGVDAYIQKNQQYKERLEKLKKGLMQKLLTGQIRVKV